MPPTKSSTQLHVWSGVTAWPLASWILNSYFIFAVRSRPIYLAAAIASIYAFGVLVAYIVFYLTARVKHGAVFFLLCTNAVLHVSSNTLASVELKMR